jgi:hypothetical protein
MGLFWRVKTWEAKITGAQVITGFGDSLTITSPENFFRTLTLNPSLNINKEEDLVCYAGDAFNFESNFPIKRTFQNPPIEFDGVAAMQFRYVFDEIRKVGDIYYPYLQLYLAGDGANSYSFGDGVKVGTYTITYAGYSATRDLFYSFDPSPFVASGNLSIEIQAKEYWPYGETYNTSTGLPL